MQTNTCIIFSSGRGLTKHGYGSGASHGGRGGHDRNGHGTDFIQNCPLYESCGPGNGGGSMYSENG